jgi:hypothetical protein
MREDAKVKLITWPSKLSYWYEYSGTSVLLHIHASNPLLVPAHKFAVPPEGASLKAL